MNTEHFEFYKKDPSDKIFWIDQKEKIGERLFTFDKKKIFNLFVDYPYNMTEDEIKIFDQENAEWRDFFKDRHLRRMIDKYKEEHEDPSVADLIIYAEPNIDEALKLITRVIQEGRTIVAVYPGLNQEPEPGMEHVGSIIDGGLYIK